MRILCTICSKSKNETPGLLPARERYTGKHVIEAVRAASRRGLPLFFLSGEYGFISADTEIPFYDHYLHESEVAELTKQVTEQLTKKEITEVFFYTEHDESWKPYEDLLRAASSKAGVLLCLVHLE